jgi:hypothetical protein
MATRMQQRRGTAAQWTAANPILAAGEIGFETDTSKFKMGNGSSNWEALTYFANATELAAAIDAVVGIAPETLDTLAEIAEALGDNPDFLTNYATIEETTAAITESRATSALDATGKANGAITAAAVDATSKALTAKTEAVATASADATSKVSEHSSATTDIHGITDTENLATKTYADAAVTLHNEDNLSVHGIANTALLATIEYADAAADAAAALVTTGTIGLGNVDNTSDANKPVSTAQATAISDAVSNHNLETENVHGIADTEELVTQTQLANAIGGAEVDQSTLAGEGLEWNSGTDKFDVDSTHITTATQTALDLKAPLASPTFTGTVVLPTVTAGGSIVPGTDNIYDLGSPTKMWKDIYVGPGSLYVNGQKVIQDESGAIVVSADVDENLGLRTSGSGNIELDPTGTGSVNIKGPLVVEAGAAFSSNDGNGIAFSNGIKADSVASNTLNTDLSLSGNGTGKVYLNDNAEVNGNLVVGGNLTVSGTTTIVNSETISLADNIIDLNSNFTTGTPTENSGLRIMRGDLSAVQIRWNESTDKWEITTDGTNYSVIAGLDSPTFTGTVTIPAGASISGYAPTANPTFTGTVTVAAAGVAFTDGTQTKLGVPSVTTIATTLAAGARTLAAGEQDKFIPLAGAVVITLPATGYSTGQSIDFYQESSTGARFESTNGVVGTPGLKFRTTNSVVTAMKTSSGWLVFGDLSA